jgi:ElaB/YqjD/DUF883 family membrane-anchored ribosome-binding protein
MAHSPLACHVMEKNFQAANHTQHLFEVLQSLNAGLNELFEQTRKTEQKITEIRASVMEMVKTNDERVKEGMK